jgi:site-specific DNA-cytosine methylase
MGWSDERIDCVMNSDISETQLYKMAGNSIVVNCLSKIVKILFNPLFKK